MTSEIEYATSYIILVGIYFIVYSFALTIYFTLDKDKNIEITSFHHWMKNYVFKWIITVFPLSTIYAIEIGYGYIAGYFGVELNDFNVIISRINPISWIFFILSIVLILTEAARTLQKEKEGKLLLTYIFGAIPITALTGLTINTTNTLTIFGDYDFLLLWSLVLGFWIGSYFIFSDSKFMDKFIKKISQNLKIKYKSRIVDFVLAFIVMLVIPLVGFFTINHFVPLYPTLYVISSLSGFYVICFLAMIEINKNLKRIYWKAINYVLFIAILPLLAFYSFDFITPIQLTSQHFAEAGFSYIFSIGVAAGFELLRPRKKEKTIVNKKS